MTVRERYVDTPGGPARLLSHRAAEPRAALLVSHGAGAGIETADLAALAQHLPRNGVTVHLLEQPWKVAGRRIAGPPATLDVALRAVAEQVASELAPAVYLDRKGRSKWVRYWAVTVLRHDASADLDGVDELRWVPLAEVADRLTYQRDLPAWRALRDVLGVG